MEGICTRHFLWGCKSQSTNKTKIPAKANRDPAKTKIEAVSCGSIANKAYPFLMNGPADPHKEQQKMAIKVTNQDFFQIVISWPLSFLPIPSNVRLRLLASYPVHLVVLIKVATLNNPFLLLASIDPIP